MKKLMFLVLFLSACSPLREIETPHPNPQPTTTATDLTTMLRPSTTPTPHVCTVTAENLHLRSGAGMTYPVIDYLYAGDVLTLNDTPGKWIEVTTQANVTGWINSNYCTKGK